MIFEPHNYQTHCINKVLETETIALLLDMGLGKSVIALTAIDKLLYDSFEISKVLIIAPKKVAESTWTEEVAKWGHTKHLKVSLVLGSLKCRLKALEVKADIYVINRENVVWLVELLKNTWWFDMVVVDELSSFKNPQAKRLKALCSIRNHIKRIVGLTGTPAPNGLMDIWAQIFLLDKGERLGKYITHFRNIYFDPDKRNQAVIFSYKLKPEADKVIWDKLKDICVSMSAEDYLELPECTYVTHLVQLDEKSKHIYDTFEREAILEIEDEVIDAGNAAVLTNKLLQICNGAIYAEDREVKEVHDCKLEAFMELVEGLNGKSALVFYNFQHDYVRLTDILGKSKLRIRKLESAKDITDWNTGKIDLLLAHPASAGYGLNLQKGGNHVIWFGLNWSLELYQQANKRLHRQGQTEKVIVHHLVVKGGVDQLVMRALSSKDKVQADLLEALKEKIEAIRRGQNIWT